MEVKFNDFTGLWQVHGNKVSYWMFEGQARKRAAEIQSVLSEKGKAS